MCVRHFLLFDVAAFYWMSINKLFTIKTSCLFIQILLVLQYKVTRYAQPSEELNTTTAVTDAMSRILAIIAQQCQVVVNEIEMCQKDTNASTNVCSDGTKDESNT